MLAKILILIALIIPVELFAAANYPLEIIQPRANLNPLNRFYKAYPGLEYNVRMAVIGGVYPFSYSLTTYPTGMTIDEATGEITWSNPTTVGSPHAVTAKVVDSDATEQTVSWTITVTTSGFRFIDAVDGLTVAGGGTGTLANPWKTMADFYEGSVYGSKYAASYAGEFLYWRSGTYELDAYKENCVDPQTDVSNECRVPFVEGYKPVVWLAYPGETPIINHNSGGHDAYIMFYQNSNNTYIDGLTFDVNGSTRSKSIVFAGGNDTTYRRNTTSGIDHAHAGGNNSLFFVTDGQRVSVQDNIASDVTGGGYFVLGYHSIKNLIENNIVSGIGGHSISAKTDTKNWTIRGNKITGSTVTGISTQCYPDLMDTEISHNYVKVASGDAMRLNFEWDEDTGAEYIHHNTLVGPVELINAVATNGPWRFYNNVIVNSTAGDKVTKTGWTTSSSYTNIDSLSETVEANILDSNGFLLPAYAEYVGIMGWQTAGYVPPVCDYAHPSLCLTEGTCEAITGLYWCDSACQYGECAAEPVCDYGHPSLCLTQETCEAVAGLHWCDGVCQVASCETPNVSGAASLSGSQAAALSGSQGATIQ